uniref:Uncharacterized protein n=1 Tax=viral metagenome TaxID=1070528 RepID=A0A6M3Y3E6_9ZZZZ
MLRNIWKGIRNIFKWLPIIWHDRDWDHYFLYEVLRFKLSEMEKHLRLYGHHEDAEKDADVIRICIGALERLIEDDYCKELLTVHHEKWGEIGVGDGGRLVYPNVKTEEDKELCSDELRHCFNEEEKAILADLDLVFGTMKENIRSWWD